MDALEKTHPDFLKRVLVIDFNPVTLDELKRRGIHAVFGDISSMETLEHAHLHHAKVIVSTIPDILLKGVDNHALVRMAKAIAPHSHVIATADDGDHEKRLRQDGAHYVIRPHDLAGERLAVMLTDAKWFGDVQEQIVG